MFAAVFTDDSAFSRHLDEAPIWVIMHDDERLLDPDVLQEHFNAAALAGRINPDEAMNDFSCYLEDLGYTLPLIAGCGDTIRIDTALLPV